MLNPFVKPSQERFNDSFDEPAQVFWYTHRLNAVMAAIIVLLIFMTTVHIFQDYLPPVVTDHIPGLLDLKHGTESDIYTFMPLIIGCLLATGVVAYNIAVWFATRPSREQLPISFDGFDYINSA